MGAPRASTSRCFDGKGLGGHARHLVRRERFPMMADKRFVLIRQVDAMTHQRSRMRSPTTSTTPRRAACVVLTAEKLDGRWEARENREEVRRISDRCKTRFEVESFGSSSGCGSSRHASTTLSRRRSKLLLDAVGR